MSCNNAKPKTTIRALAYTRYATASSCARAPGLAIRRPTYPQAQVRTDTRSPVARLELHLEPRVHSEVADAFFNNLEPPRAVEADDVCPLRRSLEDQPRHAATARGRDEFAHKP